MHFAKYKLKAVKYIFSGFFGLYCIDYYLSLTKHKNMTKIGQTEFIQKQHYLLPYMGDYKEVLFIGVDKDDNLLFQDLSNSKIFVVHKSDLGITDSGNKLCEGATALLEALRILIGEIERSPIKYTKEEKIKIAKLAIEKATI